jgi:hypothetical protein
MHLMFHPLISSVSSVVRIILLRLAGRQREAVIKVTGYSCRLNPFGLRSALLYEERAERSRARLLRSRCHPANRSVHSDVQAGAASVARHRRRSGLARQGCCDDGALALRRRSLQPAGRVCRMQRWQIRCDGRHDFLLRVPGGSLGAPPRADGVRCVQRGHGCCGEGRQALFVVRHWPLPACKCPDLMHRVRGQHVRRPGARPYDACQRSALHAVSRWSGPGIGHG